MIVLKTAREIELMKEACEISAGALKAVGEAIEPGISTKELDSVAAEYIKKAGATPNFLNYGGFPAVACISINNEVIHGIPSKHRIIKEGDIVSVDLGAAKHGLNGDNAATFACGKVSDIAQKLIDVTRESLYIGIEAIKPGGRLGDISHAVQEYVESNGFSVVKQYVGHGIGTKLHEEPNVPNYGKSGRGVRLLPGMCLAIEPMVNEGIDDVNVLQDGWTVTTVDGKLSAHFEHTVAITANGPVILTRA